MTEVRSILRDAIKAAGGDGLVNPDNECGCDTDDLAPCPECLDLDRCQVARKIKSEPDSEEMENYGPEYYEVM
jgi:hypothetical protein